MLPIRAAAAATLTLSIAACGGGGDVLGRTELVSQASAIGRDFDSRIKEIPQPGAADGSRGENGTEAEQITYYTKLASALGSFADRLEGLEAADDVKDDWAALTSAFSDSADATSRIVDQAKRKDEAGGRKTAEELDALDGKATAAAKKLGLEDCGA